MSENGIKEKSYLLEDLDRLPNHYRVKVISAQCISILIAIINLIISSMSSNTIETKISLAFSTSNLLNILSFVVMLWRFSPKNGHLQEKKALKSLAFIFVACSILIDLSTIYAFINKTQPYPGWYMIIFKMSAFVLYLLLSMYNFFLSTKTKTNGCLSAVGVSSAASAISSLSTSVSGIIYKSYPQFWYLDYITGICIGCVILLYGFKVFLKLDKH